MRTITITRRKTYIGCLVKLRVYIEDPTTPELTISGTPCRLLGTMKNGETVTFPIPTTPAKLFVIADKASRSYSSELLPIPEGEDNIYVSGKCHYNTVEGHPFRFDGITGEATMAHRTQTRKKGFVVYAVAIAVALVIGLLVGFADLIFPAKPETFTKDNFSITLTNRFDDYAEEGYLVCFEDYDMAILVEKYLKSTTEFSTAKEFANAVATDDTETYPLIKGVTEENGLLYFDYEYEDFVDHFAYCCYYYEDGGYFYIVTLACEYSDYDDLRATITEYAKSVTFN